MSKATSVIGFLSLVLVGLGWGCNKGAAPGSIGSTLSARDERGAQISLRIEAIEKDTKDAEGELDLYMVSYRTSLLEPWRPYCLPDREGKTHAIPLSGHWTETHEHVDSEAITFACTNGALGKCVRFGYKPWKKLEGGSMRDLHQACIRMVRADYCGNGRSHTRDGTLIDVWDTHGIQRQELAAEPPLDAGWSSGGAAQTTRARYNQALDVLRNRGEGQVPASDLIFEAGWSPAGATYVARARYNEALDVLQRECPERLAGRTALDLPGLDAAGVRSRFQETVLFNSSRRQTEAP